jgi:hypothetical protein
MLKTLFYNLLFFICLVSVSCGSGSEKKSAGSVSADSVGPSKPVPVVHHFAKFETGKVIKKIPCAGNAALDFALYLPKDYDTAKSWPLICFFDAHARGMLPVSKYKELAEKYQVIVVGSNNSQNGLQPEQYNNIVDNLLGTAVSVFNINPEMIMASGFSGGAKVAANAAIKTGQIKAVIGCAAPFDIKTLGSGYFTYAGAVGKGDFNYWDMVDLDNAVDKVPLKHKLFIFEGIHEWPDVNTYSQAIDFVIKSQKENTFQHKAIDVDQATREREQNMKNAYLQSFQTQSAAYWMGEVNKLNAGFLTGTGEAKWMNRRLLSFINMMTYLRTTELLNGNHLDEAAPFMEVFIASDRKNPDGPYLKADYYALRGDKSSAVKSLNDAIKLGYDDFSHFNTDPMLASLKGDPGYARVKSKLNY